MDKVLFSSERMDWETPHDLFAYYDSMYHFTLDVCADEFNKKVEKFFCVADNGLAQDWSGYICWMNPPYGRDIIKWVEKAYNEKMNNNVRTVALLPSRTDTKWFQDYVLPIAKIEFLRGRLKFVGAKSSAPFPSIIAIY